MNLKLTNTLTKKKEVFSPLVKDNVSLYVCGITPYDLSHIGHGRCYVAFDVLYRLLTFLGYNVTYVRNYTDIDDKLLAKAAATENKKNYSDIATEYIKHYQHDMALLGCLTPKVEPKVTEHIEHIIDFIQGLIHQNKAYIVNHDVYFDIASFPGYGKLSGKNIEELEAGSRVKIDKAKKNPHDFALWKGSEQQQFWPSPWGYGRPGWHIECSAMAKAYLGATIDIHGGGADLAFPHHENEIAQSEGLHQKPFAHYWLHNAFVNINKEKMSKSLGNIISLQQLFKHSHPMVVRYFFLQHHYRTPIDFSITELNSIEVAYKKLIRHFDNLPLLTLASCQEKIASDKLLEEMVVALCDDMNTPKMLGLIFQNIKELTDQPKRASIVKSLLQNVLGLALKPLPQKTVKITPEIKQLLEQRAQARAEKNWDLADNIRGQLESMGVDVHDKKTSADHE